MTPNLLLILQIIQLAEEITPGIIGALHIALSSGHTIDELITEQKTVNDATISKADEEIAADSSTG